NDDGGDGIRPGIPRIGGRLRAAIVRAAARQEHENDTEDDRKSLAVPSAHAPPPLHYIDRMVDKLRCRVQPLLLRGPAAHPNRRWYPAPSTARSTRTWLSQP